MHLSGVFITLCTLLYINSAVPLPLIKQQVAVPNDVSINKISAYPYGHGNRDTAHDHFSCPSVYGRYAHPENCVSYYECKNGWPTLKKCRSGQWYDEDRQQCRDKRRVQCHRDGHDPDKDKETVKDFKCPYIWGSFPHPVDCSKYYLCVYKVPALLQCEGSQLFHDQAHKCMDRRKVKCGKRLDRDEMRTSKQPTTKYRTTTARSTDAPSSTESIPTTVGRQRFHCPFRYGRYPDPEDCSRYFSCAYFIPSHHQCPRSTLYDERREECHPEKQVRCGKRPGGTDEENPEEEDGDFKCPYTWGTFPHPKDCAKYIICVYNVPTLFNCRKNELFDAFDRRCRPKEQVDCDYRINLDDLTKPPVRSTSTAKPVTTTIRIKSTRVSHLSSSTLTPTTHYRPKSTQSTTKLPTTFITTESPTSTTPRVLTTFTPTVFTTDTPTAVTTDSPTTVTTDSPTTVTTDSPTTVTTDSPTTVTTDSPAVSTDTPTVTTDTPTVTTDTPTVTTDTPTVTTDTPTVTTDTPTTVTTDTPTTVTTDTPTTVTTDTSTAITTDTPTAKTTDTPIAITTDTPTVTTDFPTTNATETPIAITTDTPTAITTDTPTTIITEAPKITTTEGLTTTDEPTTADVTESSVVPTTESPTTTTTISRVTKPNTPPPTDCDEDDIDCIIDETGDVKGWFECPERYGHFPHGSNPQLFIHCDNWTPFIKSCADGTVFSPKFLVCMWIDDTRNVIVQ